MVGGDHSRFGLEWNIGSYGILFEPLLLSLFNVPNLHIHKYIPAFLTIILCWFHGLAPGLEFGILFFCT